MSLSFPIWRHAYNFASVTVSIVNLHAAYGLFVASSIDSEPATKFRTTWMCLKLCLGLMQLPVHGIFLNGYRYGFFNKVLPWLDLTVPSTFIKLVKVCNSTLMVCVPVAMVAGFLNSWPLDDVVTTAIWSAVLAARLVTVHWGTHDATWTLLGDGTAADRKKE
jgi:hypothetical protein